MLRSNDSSRSRGVMHFARQLSSALISLALLACARDRTLASAGTVYELAHNLELAEIHREVASIDFGSEAARDHLIQGWSYDETIPGSDVNFVWSLGERSRLGFFLTSTRALPIAFRVFPLIMAGPQAISVEVNGKQVAKLALEEAPKEYRLVLPADRVRSGTNELTFRYGVVRRPSELDANLTDSRPLAVGWDWLRFEGVVDDLQQPSAEGNRLHLPVGSRIDFFIRGMRETVFSLDEVNAFGESRLKLSIAVDGQSTSAETVRVFPTSLGRTEVALPTLGHDLARLSLQVDRAGQSESAMQGVTLVGAKLRTAQRPVDARVKSAPTARRARPNVIIYLVDALRADRLGCYGYRRNTTPSIDAFAHEAIRFENALAQSAWTRTAIASIFTGLSPSAHGVLGSHDALASSLPTLAEILRAEGYYTAAFSTNENAGAPFEFDQGFVEFVSLPWHDSQSVTQRAVGWLRQRPRDTPFLLYVHTVDPHSPYSPPSPFRERFADGASPAEVGSDRWLRSLHEGRIVATPELVGDLNDLYDGEVASNDASFGTLLDSLRAQELYEDSIVIFLADHGEEFHDHGAWEHTHTLYDEVLRIPLILKLPGELNRPGLSIETAAQQLDILPSVLSAAGVEAVEGLPGTSLLDLLSGASLLDLLSGRSLLDLLSKLIDRPRSIYSYSYTQENGASRTSVSEGAWKLIRVSRDDHSSEVELYDRNSDPEERVNLRADRSELAQHLAESISKHEEMNPPRAEAAKAEIDSELRKRLEALGYLN